MSNNNENNPDEGQERYMRYLNPEGSFVLVMPEGWCVPWPCETYHRAIIEERLAEGETIEPYVAPPAPVPRTISRVQFLITANRHGFLSAIESIMADPETDLEVKIAWDHAKDFMRSSPTIEALRQHPSINLTSEQVDDLFREAAQVVV